jgi:hypothetical protein
VNARPDILRKAANVVRKGWVQGELEDPMGRHCALGALRTVSDVELYTMPLPQDPVFAEVTLLADLIGPNPHTTDAHSTLTDWNDEPGRTADDVITLLEQAAEKAEADR